MCVSVKAPLPRYTETWDGAIVTGFLKSLGSNSLLTTKMFTQKLAMLLSLTVPGRCSELAARDLRFRRFYPDAFNLAAFNEDLNLCPCAYLEEYERRTSAHRILRLDQPNLLFLSLIKPFKPVSSSTIARWIKQILSLPGIDIDIFKAVLQLLPLLIGACPFQRYYNSEIGHRKIHFKNFIIDLNHSWQSHSVW